MESGYRLVLDTTPEKVWETVVRIGGRRGWYGAKFLWAIRGFIDRILGRHDRARGPERQVFRNVRFMRSASTQRKLRMKEYLRKWV